MQRRVSAILMMSLILFLIFAPHAYSRSSGAAIPVPYALADGTRLTSFLSLPAGYQEGKKYPGILLIHGGRGDGKGALERADVFLQTGPVKEHLRPNYVVFSAAYHTDYFGGPHEIESMAAALKAMASLPQVDQGRIAALGVSHGGYLALMCAVHPQIPKMIKTAVSISGVVDVAAFLLYRYRPTLKGMTDTGYQPPGLAASPAVRALGWPPDKDARTRENYGRLSVISYLGNLQVPILVAHGAKDNIVPVSQARSLKEALEEQKKTFEYLEVPTGKSGGHFIFLSSKEMWERIDLFLKKYLYL